MIRTNVALHVTVGHESTASISTQIGVLRRLLLGSTSSTPLPRLLELGRSLVSEESAIVDDVDYFALAGLGYLPLVVNVWKADHMATLLHLKSEIDTNVALRLDSADSTSSAPTSMRMIFHGGQEAHMLADEIASAGVGVIVSPPRPLPESWDERRAPASTPLDRGPLPAVLESHGVKVAIGVPEEWAVVQLGWEAGWAARNSNASREGEGMRKGRAVGKEQAMAWLTTNLEDMLALPRASPLALGSKADFVAWRGDPLDLGSSVVAVVESGKVSTYP